MKTKRLQWECSFERIRNYPDCFQDCPDISECKMKDSWKHTRPLNIKATVSFPIDIKHQQVIAFAKAMDEVLCDNDHKGGWRDCDTQYLQARMVGEIGEYFELVSRGSACTHPSDRYKKELVDIANFAMMLWDRS